ncbi:hypothetical protein [Paenibacillus sp. sgz500992]|uniref:hypothetical protein n=1 Tax=Paenibacillus sp. sgz500992 TaxID=3242476 RepID=UPI0036D2441B
MMGAADGWPLLGIQAAARRQAAAGHTGSGSKAGRRRDYRQRLEGKPAAGHTGSDSKAGRRRDCRRRLEGRPLPRLQAAARRQTAAGTAGSGSKADRCGDCRQRLEGGPPPVSMAAYSRRRCGLGADCIYCGNSARYFFDYEVNS